MSVITIITVVYNAKDDLELTLKSIESQSVKAEVVVIDGGSTDGTVEIINQNQHIITKFISEKDQGIYDAMNKGIDLATGDWIYFLNAGDVFHGPQTLELLLSECASSESDIVYGDVIISGRSRFQLNCDVSKMVIHHQGICYKKALHHKVGKYVVNKKFTIADYFFFNLILPFNWKKTPQVIAICDASGVSSQMKSYYSKMCVDFTFGRLTILKFSLFVIAYPIYKILKNIINFKSFYAK